MDFAVVELSRVLKDRGRGPESEAPTREALAIRKKIFGDEHRETATSKNELGLLMWEQGKLDEAKQLFRENLSTTFIVRLAGPRRCRVMPEATSPGWKQLTVTPVPSRRRPSSNVNSMLASLDSA